VAETHFDKPQQPLGISRRHTQPASYWRCNITWSPR